MMLLLVAGCEMFPEDEPIAPQEGAVPTIAAKLVGDTKFEVTVTPAQGTAYYGYLISDKKVDVTGTGLVSVSYEGVVAGNADAREDATSAVQIVLDGKNVTVNSGKPAELAATVQPATKYYIYAAGNSEQGLASAVVMDSVWTTDATVPDMSKAKVAATDSTVVITMNTVVKRGTGKVTYSAYDAAGNAVAQDIQVTDKDKLLAVDGKTVTFSTPDSITIGGKKVPTPGGVIIALNWEAKAFTNASPTNTKDIEALKSVVGSGTIDPLTLFEREGKYGEGVVYRAPVKPWSLRYPTKGDVINNVKLTRSWANDTLDIRSELILFTDDTKIETVNTKNLFEYHWISPEAGEERSAQTTLDSYSYIITADTLVNLSPMSAYMPNEANAKMVSIFITEGSFTDIYGNPNAEFESNFNYVRPSDLTIDDIVASDYSVLGQVIDTIYNHQNLHDIFNSASISIEKIKEENFGGLKCNILIKNLFYEGSELKAVFHEEISTIQIPANQVLKLSAKKGKYSKYNNGKEFDYDVVFDTPDHSPLTLLVSVENQSISLFNGYPWYKVDNFQSNLVVKDGQITAINPWYQIESIDIRRTIQ